VPPVGRFALAVSVLALLALPGQARAAVPLTPCGKKVAALQCGTVTVPIDRTGVTPGKIDLHVEVLPAAFARGVMFLVAGGPGQGSATAFDLGIPDEADFFRFLFPNYTLVAFDNRGTGESGLIDCPKLQQTVATSAEQGAALARDCADLIGPTRRFYTTRDHADDIEAVRTALGFGKIALYGVSYGTKLALAYALGYPNSIERLVLDSVLPTNFPEPYDRNVDQSMPHTLEQLCADARCRGITSDIAGDAVAVANSLEAKPVVGPVIALGGGVVKVHVTGEDVLTLIVDSDLSPGIQAELPAALRAARTGYLRPLLRLVYLDRRSSTFPAKDLSFGLNVATNCADGVFPWSPETAPSARAPILSSTVAGLPAGSFGPFGAWAARLGTSYECELWPSPAGNAPLGPGPLPNVPMIAFSGGLDFRTPTADAAAVTALFPQGHLVVVPGVGHNVLNPLLSGLCPFSAVRSWLDGATPPSTCAREPALENPIGLFPQASPRRSPSVTALDAVKAVREGEAAWLQFLPFNPAGLYGGTVSNTPRGFRLKSYAIVRGVQVTGTLKINPKRPLALTGTVRVTGLGAAPGSLRISGGRVSGTLGGKRVSARL
jgi:pimeloyl-ACP methyl ester carboxylesterase